MFMHFHPSLSIFNPLSSAWQEICAITLNKCGQLRQNSDSEQKWKFYCGLLYYASKLIEYCQINCQASPAGWSPPPVRCRARRLLLPPTRENWTNQIASRRHHSKCNKQTRAPNHKTIGPVIPTIICSRYDTSPKGFFPWGNLQANYWTFCLFWKLNNSPLHIFYILLQVSTC